VNVLRTIFFLLVALAERASYGSKWQRAWRKPGPAELYDVSSNRRRRRTRNRHCLYLAAKPRIHQRLRARAAVLGRATVGTQHERWSLELQLGPGNTEFFFEHSLKLEGLSPRAQLLSDCSHSGGMASIVLEHGPNSLE